MDCVSLAPRPAAAAGPAAADSKTTCPTSCSSLLRATAIHSAFPGRDDRGRQPRDFAHPQLGVDKVRNIPALHRKKNHLLRRLFCGLPALRAAGAAGSAEASRARCTSSADDQNIGHYCSRRQGAHLLPRRSLCERHPSEVISASVEDTAASRPRMAGVGNDERWKLQKRRERRSWKVPSQVERSETAAAPEPADLRLHLRQLGQAAGRSDLHSHDELILPRRERIEWPKLRHTESACVQEAARGRDAAQWQRYHLPKDLCWVMSPDGR